MRLHRFLAGCALLTATHLATAADYTTSVQQAYTPTAEVRRIALVPLTCPADIDCEDLEESVTKQLSKRIKLQLLPAAETRALMDRAGITRLDHETRYILAEGLKVDGFVSVDIPQATVRLIEGKMARVGMTEVQEPPTRIKQVKLVVNLTSKDGTVLLQSDGEAQLTSLRGLDTIAAHTFEEILKASVPEEKE